MRSNVTNPAAGQMRQGPDKSKRAALITGPYNTKLPSLEEYCATYVSRKYRLSAPMARTIARLAQLGGRHA